MATRKPIYAFILFPLLFISCKSSIQMKKGDIVNRNYSVEIPFSFEDHMILVDVDINGKTYTFMFDSGAELNLIDQSIADDMNIEASKTMKIKGSSNTTKRMGRTVIPSMQLGPLEVRGSVAVISDFNFLSRFLGCYDIKGIIGNNIMRRANMQIDYENKVIRMTDSEQPFRYSDQAHIIKMNAPKVGNVKLKLTIGDKEQYVTFDTGYSGKIKSNDSTLLTDHPSVSSAGVTGASIHQVNIGTTTDAFVKELDLAGMTFTNQEIVVKHKSSSLVGNQFFKHFTISVDWQRDELILDPIISIQPDTIKPFELSLSANFNTNKIEIAKLYPDYTDFDEELIGWHVDKINGQDITTFNKAKLCSYWKDLKAELKNINSLALELSNEGEMRAITVGRIDFDHDTLIDNTP